jgi:hypothetical protein
LSRSSDLEIRAIFRQVLTASDRNGWHKRSSVLLRGHHADWTDHPAIATTMKSNGESRDFIGARRQARHFHDGLQQRGSCRICP